MRFLYSTRERHPAIRVDLAQLFSNGLATKGHCVDWHMQAMAHGPTRVEKMGLRERVFVGRAFGNGGAWLKLLNQLSALRHDLRLIRFIRCGRYDFIQVRDKAFAAMVGLLAARRKGLPFYYWMSFPYAEADSLRARDRTLGFSMAERLFYFIRGALIGWLLYRVLLRRADHIFVQSDRMKKDVAERGVLLEKMTVVPMGVNLEQVKNADHIKSDDPCIVGRLPLVYMGTLVRVRRIDFLVEMLPRVLKHFPDALLVLVGDAPERDLCLLRDAVERLRVGDSVIFMGFVPIERAWAYVRSARVCLSPFRPSRILDSCSPTKVVEYMAWGRPVVANRHPDQSKVLEESGAGLAVAYEPKAFADAVIELLYDHGRAEAMGARGVDYVRKHRSYRALSANLERQYLKLLGIRREAMPTESCQ